MIKNSSKQRGFTLIELLIVMAILGILVIVVLIGLGSFFGGGPSSEEIHDHCKVQANEYAANTGRGVRAVTCMDQDSNWDNYVTATIFFEDKSTITLDCALPGSYGCKKAEQKIVHNRGLLDFIDFL